MKRTFLTAIGLFALLTSPATATDTCLTPDPGDVYYVLYQNNPRAPSTSWTSGPRTSS